MCMCVHMCVNTTGGQRSTSGVLPKDVKLIFNNFICVCVCIIYVLWLYFDHIYSELLLLTPPRSILFSLFPKCFKSNCADHDLWLSTEMFLTHQRSYPVFSLPRTHQPSVALECWLTYRVPVTTQSWTVHAAALLCPEDIVAPRSPQTSGSHNPALLSTGSLSLWGGERDVAFVSESLLGLIFCTWICCEAVC